jgi:ribosome maturation factor RimP
MLSKVIVDAVSRLAEPIAGAVGCEVWDVEYVKEAGQRYLRVYIDKPGGASINDCETVSRALDPLLDERESLITESYILEISSAGAERPLRRSSDFERFIGSLVEVRLYKPRGAKGGGKEFVGRLRGYNGGDVEIEFRGEVIRFEKSEIANVRLRIE